MFLRNPYDFRSLQLLRMETTVQGINNLIITDYGYNRTSPFTVNSFHSNDSYLNAIVLYGKSPLEKDIPVFGHPLLVDKNKWIALDLRQCTKLNKETSIPEIRNQSEFNFAVNRFTLSGLWAVGKGQALHNNSFPMSVYGDWLSSNLTRVFGLGMGDQAKLFILSCLFYSTLFSEVYGQEEKEKFALRIKNFVPFTDTIEEVVGKVDKLDTIDDFCRLAYEVTNNVRLKDLNFVALSNVISKNWFGLNAGEITLVSLVHPPTWVALVYAATSDRGFRNTTIAKIAENRGRRNVGVDFVKEISNLIKTSTGD
ncbi:hypothetical protein [Flavobacterium sp.]|jgi:hypothetical protein|uniref:hypothetical protein n=1 Tax=Flavobacterium sp. TaxID=239 RepID=UPI0037BE395F